MNRSELKLQGKVLKYRIEDGIVYIDEFEISSVSVEGCSSDTIEIDMLGVRMSDGRTGKEVVEEQFRNRLTNKKGFSFS